MDMPGAAEVFTQQEGTLRSTHSHRLCPLRAKSPLEQESRFGIEQSHRRRWTRGRWFSPVYMEWMEVALRLESIDPNSTRLFALESGRYRRPPPRKPPPPP